MQPFTIAAAERPPVNPNPVASLFEQEEEVINRGPPFLPEPSDSPVPESEDEEEEGEEDPQKAIDRRSRPDSWYDY